MIKPNPSPASGLGGLSRLMPWSAHRPLVMRILLSVLVLGALGAVVLYPVANLFLKSFQRSWYDQDSTFTLTHYLTLFKDKALREDILTTIVIAFWACLIASTLGVALAWIVTRTDIPFKGTLNTLNLIPFFLNSVVGAAGWQIIAAPRTGVLNKWWMELTGGTSPLFSIYSRAGIALVIGLFYVPYAYLYTISALKNMDPSLEEAAVISGAGRLRTALKITIPLALPGILSSAILILVTAAGLVGVPLLLGRPGHVNTLSTNIYGATQDLPPNYNLAAALSAVLFMITVFLLVVERKLIKNRSFVSVSGKGYRPAIIKMGKWRYALLGFNGLYLIAIFVPLFTLVLTSFQNQWTGSFKFSEFTLRNYSYILFDEATAWRGFKNSMIIALVGATIAVILCAALAYVTKRSRMPGRGIADFIIMMPATVPGIVLGVGFLMAWTATPLHGTIWMLMLAYMVNYLPLGVKNTAATLLSLSPELEESGRMSGATWGQTFRSITLPLMRPGLTTTWILLFVAYFREVGASIILYMPGTETVSVSLIRIMQYEAFGVTAAFAVLQTLVMLVVLLIFNRVVGVGSLSGQRSV